MFTLKLVDEPVAAPAPVATPAAPAVVVPSGPSLTDLLAKVEALTALAQPKAVTEAPKAPEIPKFDDTDFILNPSKVVSDVVLATLQRQSWDQAEAVRVRQEATAKVLSAMPDALDTQKSEGFKAFVASNAAVAKLYGDAVSQVNPDNVLLSLQLYAASSATTPAAAESNPAVQPVAPSGMVANGSTTFSRAALETLQRVDPDKYAQMSDQIMEAYRTGNITN